MPRKKKAVKEDEGRPIDDVLNRLKSRYPGRVFTGREYTMPWMVRRLPTGVIDLDIALNGGFPAGGLSVLVGKPGVGKNWVANKVIQRQQQIYGEDTNIGVINTETCYDKVFAQLSGVSVALSDDEIGVLASEFKEDTGNDMEEAEVKKYMSQIGTFVTTMPDTAEKCLQIAVDMVSSRAFHVVVIDSFGSLLIDADEDKSLDENVKVAGPSSVNTQFMKKLSNALAPDKDGNPNLTCILGINQARDNQNRANKYSPELKESGGWALKHGRLVTVELSPAGKVRSGGKKTGLIVGKKVRWNISKQKAGGHEGGSGVYDFIWSRCGMDPGVHLVDIAVDYDVVKRSGTWYSYDGERLGQGLFASAAAAEEMGLLSEIEAAVLASAGIRYRT